MLLLILSFLIWRHAAAGESDLFPCPNSNPYRAQDSRCLTIEEICSKSQANQPQEIPKSELLALLTQLNKGYNITHEKLESNKKQFTSEFNMTQEQLKRDFAVLLGFLVVLSVIVFITWIILLLEVRFKIITKFCEGNDIRKSRKYILIDAQFQEIQELKANSSKYQEQSKQMLNDKFEQMRLYSSHELQGAEFLYKEELKSMLEAQFQKVQTEIQELKIALSKYEEQSKQMINDKLKPLIENPNLMDDSSICTQCSEEKTTIADDSPTCVQCSEGKTTIAESEGSAAKNEIKIGLLT